MMSKSRVPGGAPGTSRSSNRTAPSSATTSEAASRCILSLSTSVISSVSRVRRHVTPATDCRKSSVRLRRGSLQIGGSMEAAGIEPASSESDAGSRPDGNPDDSEPGRLRPDDGHEVDRLDDDPRSQRGPSVETATPPGGAGDEPQG